MSKRKKDQQSSEDIFQQLAPSVGQYPRYKTTGNARAFPHTYEENSGISQTAPNMTMSVKDIINRFTGMSYPQTRELQYHGEKFVMDIAEFKRLDISEQNDLIEQARKTTMDTIKRLRRKGELKKEEDLEAFYRQKFEQEIKDKTVGKQQNHEAGPTDQE